MSGPTLGLGITATGVEQVKQLADAVARLDVSLAGLQSHGGTGTAQLSGLAALNAEVAKIRQGLGEGIAGLRTSLAELSTTVSKAMTDATSNVARSAQTGGKQAKAALEKAADDTKAGIDRYTAQLMVGSAKIVETQVGTSSREEAARLAWLAKMQTGSLKLSDNMSIAAAREEEARLAWLAKMQVGSAKFVESQAEAADREDSARLAWIAKMQVGSAKIVESQNAAAAREEAARLAWIAKMQVGSAKIIEAQTTAANREEQARLAWIAKMQVGSAKIVAAQEAAGEAEEASTAALVFRANKSLSAFLAQQAAEVAAVEKSAIAVEAAYSVLSTKQQLRRQLSAASQLEAGMPAADVVAKFGNTAVTLGQVAGVAALRAELEKMPSSAHGASLGINSIGDAFKSVGRNSGVAREALAEVDELLQNRFKNMAGTAVALLNRMGLGTAIFQGTTLALIGIAAAAGASIIAFGKGEEELKNFEKQTILTGNAIGMTDSQFVSLRDSMSQMAGVTKGKAAEALTAIAASGGLAAANVGEIAKTAVMLEQAVGIPIAKTVEQFAKLGDEPVKESLKLNETYHYLTTTILDQIETLVRHGQTVDASNLAEKAYADAMQQRAQTILDNMGTLESAWFHLKNAAKEAWDAMLNVGREKSVDQKMADAAKMVDDARAAIASGRPLTGPPVSFAAMTSANPALAQLAEGQGLEATYFRRKEIVTGDAAAQQQTAEMLHAQKQLEDIANRLDKGKKGLEAQETMIRNLGVTAHWSADQVNTLIAALEARYAKQSGGAGRLGTIAGGAVSADQLTGLYQNAMSNGDYKSVIALTAAEKELNTVNAQLAVTTDAATRTTLLKARAAAQAAIPAELEAQQVKQQYTEWQKASVEVDKFTAKVDTNTYAILKKAAATQAEVNSSGNKQTSDAQATLQEMQARLVEATAFDAKNEQEEIYIAALMREIEAQKQLVNWVDQLAIKREKLKLDEDGRKAAEDTKTIQMEYDLIGKTADQRAVIVAQRKSELDLAKQLADIDKLPADTADAQVKKEADKAEAIANARVKATNAANAKILQQWQKTADAIETSLTDALIAGFENGKGAAASLKAFLLNLFNTMILRPIIQAYVAPLAGQLGGYATQMSQMASGNSMGNGGLSNFGGLANVGTSLFSSPSAYSTVVPGLTSSGAGSQAAMLADQTGVFGAEGLGATASAGGSTAVGAGLSAAGSAIPYIGAVYAASQGQYGAAAGMAIGTMIMPGIGTVIGAIIGTIVDSFMSKKGGPKLDGTSGQLASLGAGTHTADTDLAASQGATTIQTQYDNLIKTYGATSSLKYGLGFSMDPQGTSPSFVEVAATGQNGKLAFSNVNKNAGRTQEELQTSITSETSKAILQGLQQSNLKGGIAQWLAGLGDISKLSEAQVKADMDRLTKAANERASLQTRLDNLTMTSLQKLIKTRQDEVAALDDTNKLMASEVYAAEDLATAQNNLVTAYNNDNTALSKTISDLGTYSKALRQWVTDSATGTASPLNIFEQLASSRSTFNTTLASAHSGDATARSALPNSATQYLTALQNTASDRSQYLLGYSKVTSSLLGEANTADSSTNLLQSQLDTEKAQLTALGLLNTTVQTFAQAWTDYQNAQTALATAKAAADAAAAVEAKRVADAAAADANKPVPVVINNSGWNGLPEIGAGDSGGISGDTSGSNSATSGVAAGGDSASSVGGAGSGFASGGYHWGGMRLVGENGPELEATGAAYIHDAGATRRLLSGGPHDTSDAVKELQLLRVEMRACVQQMAESKRLLKKFYDEGVPVIQSRDGTALNTHAV